MLIRFTPKLWKLVIGVLNLVAGILGTMAAFMRAGTQTGINGLYLWLGLTCLFSGAAWMLTVREYKNEKKEGKKRSE